jgi:hypothetical protein
MVDIAETFIFLRYSLVSAFFCNFFADSQSSEVRSHFACPVEQIYIQQPFWAFLSV